MRKKHPPHPTSSHSPPNLANAGGPHGAAPVTGTPVLVIDSDECIRAVLERCLQRQGFAVRQAADLDEARVIAAQYSGPVLLVDNLCVRWLAQGPVNQPR